MASRLAVAKARTALVGFAPSGGFDSAPAGIVAALQNTYGGDFVPRAGGVLVTDGDVIIGAIGASGAQSDEDEAAVTTAVERWQKR